MFSKIACIISLLLFTLPSHAILDELGDFVKELNDTWGKGDRNYIVMSEKQRRKNMYNEKHSPKRKELTAEEKSFLRSVDSGILWNRSKDLKFSEEKALGIILLHKENPKLYKKIKVHVEKIQREKNKKYMEDRAMFAQSLQTKVYSTLSEACNGAQNLSFAQVSSTDTDVANVLERMDKSISYSCPDISAIANNSGASDMHCYSLLNSSPNRDDIFDVDDDFADFRNKVFRKISKKNGVSKDKMIMLQENGRYYVYVLSSPLVGGQAPEIVRSEVYSYNPKKGDVETARKVRRNKADKVWKSKMGSFLANGQSYLGEDAKDVYASCPAELLDEAGVSASQFYLTMGQSPKKKVAKQEQKLKPAPVTRAYQTSGYRLGSDAN